MTLQSTDSSRRRMLQLALALPAATAFVSQAAAQTSGLNIPPASKDIKPFSVSVRQSAIDDLKQRLKNTRWPEKETASDWSQGVPLQKAKALIAYWESKYDWRNFEKRINAYPQFRTEIDGLGIHFIHVKSKHENALPIILTHGWPGSVVEFLKVIGPLTNPTAHGGTVEDALHVVIPSQPGFGLSDKPQAEGWNVVRTAKAWVELMTRLGYSKWVAQGGEWGSGVTHALGHIRPAGLVAAHVNWPLVFPEKFPDNPTPRKRQRCMRPPSLPTTSSAISRNRQRVHRQSATRLPTPRSARQHGSTRSFRPGPITAVNQKTL
ncbi:epoxide hydrolase family protein [Rhizobium sp. SG570]|uniref:epoxide hydrolase family protein n=1 Tax=Rhizobium sp. SG570 TaxID=2587113 RepID=UPI001838F7F0|nr:epoxide hydrolase family protein [Rhizobium sp. SG570]NKJ37581.1 pimeloyl-ACP methyl ester carboxylesterase [Rhizobium sp. SG570]NRP89264.1 Haloalkane dehalogenase [Ensifer adhaerens]